MLQDVELRQLRALLAVAQEGSFGRAAERLGFTQSAISQQIAGLERAVGDRVFDRPGGPRRVELTPIGAFLVGHATAMLAELRAAEDGLASLRAGEVGRLVVGSFQSVSVKILPPVIGRFRIERPGLAVRCVESDLNEELMTQLLDDELDLTFMVGDPGHPGIETVELLVDPFVLVTTADGPVGPMAISALAGMAMIGQQPCACQTTIDESLRRCGVEPDYVFRTNDNAAVQAMVKSGMGRAIMPFLAVEEHDPGIALVPIEPPLPPRTIFLARRKGRTLPPAANRFIELAAEVCAALPRFEPRVLEPTRGSDGVAFVLPDRAPARAAS